MNKAYGKINLSIDVLGTRENGYHDVDMIMLPIDIYDEMNMQIAEEDSYECNLDLPYNQSNIIYKCIELMRSEYHFNQRFAIQLEKHIPMQAGLAGGSSDGALAMKMVNELLHLNLSLQQLAELGKKVGADIPFCIYNQPARVQGIGEIITPLKLDFNYDLLLIKPEVGVNTGKAYQLLDLQKCSHPSMDAIIAAVKDHQPLNGLLGNSLQYSASLMVKEVDEIIDEVKAYGYGNVLMSGSGSCVFVLLEKGQDCSELEEHMKEKYAYVKKTSILQCK